MDNLLSTKDVARVLGLKNTEAVLDLIHSGELTASNVSASPGRPTWRIDPDDLRAFLAKRRSVKAKRERRKVITGVTEYV